MGKVIKFEADDWYLARQYRESVKDMKERNPEKYRLAIKEFTTTSNRIIKDMVKDASISLR